jgi:hypothetical protein
MSMLTGSAPAASLSINFDPTIRTEALRRALLSVRDEMSAADLKFLERWELSAMPGAAAALRASQLRRANPKLLAEIQAELKVAKG